MTYTQNHKLISISTALGEDVLLLTGFTGNEGISSSFRFELSLMSEKHDISFDAIVGGNATVSVVLADGNRRHFNGVISSFSHYSAGGEGDEDAPFSYYRAAMVPWFWTLSKSAGSKIFQNLSVPEIITRVFQSRGLRDYRMDLRGSYDKREFCVQYRETDFNFVSRLLEEEGIIYFFEHAHDKHIMVLADSPDSNKPCPSQISVSCRISGNATREEDVVTALEVTQQVRSCRYALSDFNFEAPKVDLKVEVQGKTQTKQDGGEIYDAPGNYGKRAAGERVAKIRMEEEEAESVRLTGSSDCRFFTSGYRFTLRDHSSADLNRDYLLLSVRHSASEGYWTESASDYQNNFECLPHAVPYRPPRMTPKPVVQGTQTAVVVGPQGEEIHTDQHGRVKVQFHWDRDGKHDDNSSCWIRVSQLWVGNGWGGFHLPRVGQEVIVDFLEGNPDRPIIVGQLHNGVNLPPYPLPAQRTRSGVRSCSTPGGEGFNEISFEDKKGEEQLLIRAEKQQVNSVKQDSLESVGQDRHLVVARNRFEKISGDQHLTVVGDRNESVNGTLSLTVGANYQQKTGDKYALEAGEEIHLKAGSRLVVESGAQVSLKVGANFINISAAGVTIVGNMVLINSGGTPLFGSGSSPDEPKLPEETGEPLTGAGGPRAEKRGGSKEQAAALQTAAQKGAPLCAA